MFEFSVVLLSSVISATTAGAATCYLLQKKAQSLARRKLPDHDLRFLFRGTELVNVTGDGEWLFETGQGVGQTDWEQFYHVMAPRFPGLFANQSQIDCDVIACPAARMDDPAELLLERMNDLLRVTLLQPEGRDTSPTDIHRQKITDQRIKTLENAVDNSPFPIWSSDQDGTVTWANDTYLQLAESAQIISASSSNIPALFDLPDMKPPANPRVRLSLTFADCGSKIWFDITSTETSEGRIHFAKDINAVVQAEIAQRNFVQTLTKTFAQLSIGLAIFDRKRQLALFNPALIDLIGLTPEYLSGRPTLLSFFDRLRDNQMMPEPKNYQGWREEMQHLVMAAADGRYLETWDLSNGLTYRVSGRPHPDGAIAFLFEDISSEVSLTRRFRSQIETMQTVLDGLPQAVAVFTSSGVLSFANDNYRKFWNSDPDGSFIEFTISDAITLWKSYCTAQTDLSPLQTGTATQITLPLKTGERLHCCVRPLIGGSFAVIFGEDETPKTHATLERIA